MFDWLLQGQTLAIVTATLGSSGVLLLIAKLVERLVPSRDLATTSQQVFMSSLLERIKQLETDRDKQAALQLEWSGKYWELQGRYEQVQVSLTAMTERCDKLQAELDNLRGRGPVGRSM